MTITTSTILLAIHTLAQLLAATAQLIAACRRGR